MMKKISRRSFLRVCGITAATAALTACGGGKTETVKKDDAHEAITFMAPYKEIEAFIEQVLSFFALFCRTGRKITIKSPEFTLSSAKNSQIA